MKLMVLFDILNDGKTQVFVLICHISGIAAQYETYLP